MSPPKRRDNQLRVFGPAVEFICLRCPGVTYVSTFFRRGAHGRAIPMSSIRRRRGYENITNSPRHPTSVSTNPSIRFGRFLESFRRFRKKPRMLVFEELNIVRVGKSIFFQPTYETQLSTYYCLRGEETFLKNEHKTVILVVVEIITALNVRVETMLLRVFVYNNTPEPIETPYEDIRRTTGECIDIFLINRETEKHALTFNPEPRYENGAGEVKTRRRRSCSEN